MNLRSMMRAMQANAIAGNACVFRSRPGVGKSDLAAQFAKWWKDYVQNRQPGARVGMAKCFIAVASPISASGLPWRTERTWNNPVTGKPVTYTFTDPAVPQWAMAVDLDTGELRPVAMFDSVILILEEWGQGSAEAKRAFAEVLYAGGTPEHKLPSGSPRFAFSNMDAADGVTKEFDFIINRAGQFHVQGDAQIWHDDFAEHPYRWQGREWQVMGVSKLWALRNPTLLFEDKPTEQGPWCTARSFTAKDRFIQSVMELEGGDIPIDDPVFVEGCVAHCGMPHTQSFNTMLKFRLELPTLEAIALDPMGTAVPRKADLQMLLCYELAGRVEKEHIASVVKYLSKRDSAGHGMPTDMNVTFVTSLMRRAPRLLNEPALLAWVSKNAVLLSIIGQAK